MALLPPLPVLTGSYIKSSAAHNREMGSRFGLTTTYADRRYAGTGDPRLVGDLLQLQRAMGLPMTGRINAAFLGRALAHIYARTAIGEAIRRNLVFPAQSLSVRYQIARPSRAEIEAARRRMLALQRRPVVVQRVRPVSRPAATQRPGPVSRPAATQRPGPVSRPAATHRPGPVSRPVATQRPGIFSPQWWDRVLARASRRQRQRQRQCVCGSTRAELIAQMNRIAWAR